MSTVHPTQFVSRSRIVRQYKNEYPFQLCQLVNFLNKRIIFRCDVASNAIKYHDRRLVAYTTHKWRLVGSNEATAAKWYQRWVPHTMGSRRAFHTGKSVKERWHPFQVAGVWGRLVWKLLSQEEDLLVSKQKDLAWSEKLFPHVLTAPF
jgi:hypothetical protein